MVSTRLGNRSDKPELRRIKGESLKRIGGDGRSWNLPQFVQEATTTGIPDSVFERSDRRIVVAERDDDPVAWGVLYFDERAFAVAFLDPTRAGCEAYHGLVDRFEAIGETEEYRTITVLVY